MDRQDPGPGIGRSELYNIHFYEKAPFSGSLRAMRYRIEGIEAESAADDTANEPGAEAKQLLVTVWPGPYNFDTTDDAQKVTARFPFSNEGLDEVAEYLNQYYTDHF